MDVAVSYELNPIKGILSPETLLHLLRRCFLGVSNNDYNFFRGRTIDECLAVLLQPSKLPGNIVQSDPDFQDPLVADGADWTNAPFENTTVDERRKLYLKAWWVGQLLNRDYSLTEKMRLFWHNHFVTEMDVVKDSRYSYRYVTMLRRHALGNYKKLIEEGTTNIAMLVYLNGNTNTKAAPNENYARELMELFTLGKGNGSAYTEEDIREAARVLTGWKDKKEQIAAAFEPELHDTGVKKFSSYFDNRVIKGKSGAAGQEEFKELIEMIISRKETAKFVCRNLYRWFVSSEINSETELKIITPLAETFVASGYEIRPVLKQLLSSEHFFDKAFRGCIVKSPVDFLIGLTLQFSPALPNETVDKYNCWINYAADLGYLSMDIGNPPSVAGWPAYYQMPKYHQWWINSSTLSFRKKVVDAFSSEDGLNCNGPRVRFAYTKFATELKNWNEPDTLIAESAKFLLAVPVTPQLISSIKGKFAGDITNSKKWAEAWDNYKSNPKNENYINQFESELRRLYKLICALPEFQML